MQDRLDELGAVKDKFFRNRFTHVLLKFNIIVTYNVFHGISSRINYH